MIKKLKKKAWKIPLKQKKKRVEELEEWLWKEENEWENSMWRPTIMTPMTIQKLKLCFAVGMTDLQACYFSEVSKSTLYEYQGENPDFLEEKEILKESITLQARLNIWWNIKKWDTNDSKWWLTMRDKDFMNKLNLVWWNANALSEEDKELYNKILKNNI